MAMSTQLSSSGAVPKAQVLSPSSGVLSSLKGLTLNPAQTSTQKQSALTADPRYSTPSIGTNPGMIQSTPTTPVKSTVDVSGNTTTYHAPKSDPNVLAQQQALNAKGAGLIEDGIAGPKTEAAIAKYGSQNNPTPQPSAPTPTSNTPTTSTQTQAGVINPQTGVNANNSTTSGVYTPPNQGTQGISQGGLIGNAVAQSQAPSKAYTDAVGEYQKVASELEKLKLEEAQQTHDINTSGTWTSRALGEQGQANIQNSATEAALSGELQSLGNVIGQSNTQQGLQQSALGTAINANAPQYGVSYGTQTGQPSQPNGGINSSALGGVAAPANIKSIQDYTGQINTTQKSVNTLNNLANQIIPNMGTTGFNPYSSPIGNQTFGEYFANSNPAASAGIKAGLGEIKNQISNVISSATGLTPTAVTGVTDSYDFTSMNPQQLSDFLQYINQYAQSNISGAQKSIDDISKGGSPSANPGLLPAPTPVSNGQAIAGTGATLAKGFIQSILSEAGNAVAGATAGATSGLAKSVLGL